MDACLQFQSKLWSKIAFFYVNTDFASKTTFSSILLQTRSIHPVSRSNFIDMPRPLSQNKSQLVKTLLAADLPHDVIATTAKCSERQVRRISYNLEHFGSVKRPKVVKQGRPSNLTDE